MNNVTGQLQVQRFTDFYTYNTYAEHIHQLNAHWWQNPDGSPKELDKGERFMLMVSELSEGMEGHRKSLNDDKLPQYPMLWVELADTIIRVMDSGHKYGWNMDQRPLPNDEDLYKTPATVGAELFNIVAYLVVLANAENHTCIQAVLEKSETAATIIDRCCALARKHGCSDIWLIVYEKLCFNQKRADHQWEHRLSENGKKF